jgi:subtilase-type serine protease
VDPASRPGLERATGIPAGAGTPGFRWDADSLGLSDEAEAADTSGEAPDEPGSGSPARTLGLMGAGAALTAVIVNRGGRGGRGEPVDAWFDEAALRQPDEALAAGIRQSPAYRFINQWWLDHRGARPNPYDLMGLSYAHSAGYLGEGVVIAVLDDSFQVAPINPATHPMFADPGKVVGLFNDMPEAVVDPERGMDWSHGSHVAGLAAGNSDTMIGVAPAAQLYLASYLGVGGVDRRPRRWGESFRASGSVGARVHTNSWGWDEFDTDTWGRQGLDTRRVRELVRDPRTALDHWAGTPLEAWHGVFADYADANGFSVAAYADNPGLAIEAFYSMVHAGTSGPTPGFERGDWDRLAGDMRSFQTDSDGVIVWALANFRLEGPDGQPYADGSAAFAELYPDLRDAWLTVANVHVAQAPDGGMHAALMSSGCQQTAPYCLSHNGTAVNSAVPVDGFDQKTGTSMATPQVAGAMAVLAEAFPGHSGWQLANRVLATASNFNDWRDVEQWGVRWYGTLTLPDGSEERVELVRYAGPDGPIPLSGGPGQIGEVDFGNGITHAYSEIFGHGFVDLRAALRPVGALNVPLGRSLESAHRSRLDSSRMVLGAAFGDGLSRGLADRRLAVLDGLDGAFMVPLGDLVGETRRPAGHHALLQRFGRSPDLMQVELGPGTMLETAFGPAGGHVMPGAGSGMPVEDRAAPRLELAELGFRHDPGARVRLRFDLNRDPAMHYGLHAAGTVVPEHMTSDGAFSNPLLAFAREGGHVGMDLSPGNRFTMRLGAFQGRDGIGSHDGSRDRARVQGTMAELAFALGEDVLAPTGGLSLQLAMLQEDDTLLGSRSGGAFDLADDTRSATVGLSGEIALGDWFRGADVRLAGSAYMAFTHPRVAGTSLFEDVSAIESHAFSLGLIGRDLIVDEDRWGLVLNRPLRVARGHADLQLPVGHDGTDLRHESVRASLTPSGRETQVEVFYGRALSPEIDVQGSVMLRRQPDHVRTAPDEGVALLNANLRF